MQSRLTYGSRAYRALPPDAKPLPRHTVLAVPLIFAALLLAPAASAQTETVLHNFIKSSGESPFGDLIADPSGNLYGTTQHGGAGGVGVVYRLNRSGEFTVLHNFTGGAGGEHPSAGVVRDAAGNLYGTTYNGGLGGGSGSGVIYKLDSGGQYTILHSFGFGLDGALPQSGLFLDASGNLYGTTIQGGLDNKGVVYELDSGGRYTVLHSFAGGTNGKDPQAGVVGDAAGNLYGTAFDGGLGMYGVVFKIDSNGHETVLHSFSNGSGGGTLYGGVIFDQAGNLYGTTYSGGAFGYGVVFKLDPSGTETVLHDFTSTPDGANPIAGLLFDASGNLYGTTEFGGTSDLGTVFKIDRNTHQESIVYSFSGQDGGPYVNGPLLMVNGNLFGTTELGGAAGGGLLFKINPTP